MYYSLLMLDKQLEIVNDMEGLTKDTWQTMQLLKDAKMGYRSTSVQAAESNYYSVLAQKADLKRQIRETENSLSLLLGEQAHAIARGKLDNQSLPANFSTGVGLQLLNNRADVHAAEMNLAQCFYGVETARSKFYPSITISGTGAFTNSAGAGIVIQESGFSLLWVHLFSLSSRMEDSLQDSRWLRCSTSRLTTLGRMQC